MRDIKHNLSMDDLDNILRQLYYNNRMESYEFRGIDNRNDALLYLLHEGYISKEETFYLITIKGQTFARTQSFNNNSTPIVLC